LQIKLLQIEDVMFCWIIRKAVQANVPANCIIFVLPHFVFVSFEHGVLKHCAVILTCKCLWKKIISLENTKVFF